VCYDIFGIKKLKRKAKPETDDVKIDAILNTVHFFYPFGKEGSGYPNFIRHGFGGASFRWNCPVFGAAVFFERKVPDDWQSGFFCKRREQIQQDIRYIAYSDNLLEQNRQDCDISTGYETAVCYLYTI
jgi:hypothetical protein